MEAHRRVHCLSPSFPFSLSSSLLTDRTLQTFKRLFSCLFRNTMKLLRFDYASLRFAFVFHLKFRILYLISQDH